jgi:endonuclease/exonuclease/phosphatase family metal-dependent hydrolase
MAHSELFPSRLRARLAACILASLAALLALSAVAEAKPATVKVMSRNVYLGADLTPGVQATSLQALVTGAGKILNEVDTNDFRIRAKGLAAEILKQQPDLVGLQEAALWRTQPCDKNPLPPSATTVRYDFLQLLLAQLNKGKKRYSLVIAKPEFDFEVWANTDGNESTAGPNCPMGSEINGRLTMRDAILAKRGSVKTKSAKSGTFDTLLQVRPAGVNVDVTRGWTSVDATVAGHKFHFVNTHLEAFDSAPTGNHTNKGTDVGNGAVREAQAKELIKSGGPATSKLPVILLGDLNSDTKTEVKPGDGLAYRALLNAHFVERSAAKPLGCCLNASVITATGGGKTSDFDHKVDHVMTDSANKVKLLSSTVTGLKPVNGFWDSDHAGLFSKLQLR